METEAIVLDCHDYGESDLILTLFGREPGRLKAIAKGARKSRKRFVNKLEIFSFLHIIYEQKANRAFAFLAEAELHNGFINIRSNLERFGTASVIQEFLLGTVREGAADEKTFRLSLWAMHSLDRKMAPGSVLALFLIRFYDYLGYRPELNHCLGCGAAAGGTIRCSFDPGRGGLLCTRCRPRGGKGLALSPGSIKILQSAQDLPLERLHRLQVTAPLLPEVLAFLHHYGRQLLQRDIISWPIMRQCSTATTANLPGQATNPNQKRK